MDQVRRRRRPGRQARGSGERRLQTTRVEEIDQAERNSSPIGFQRADHSEASFVARCSFCLVYRELVQQPHAALRGDVERGLPEHAPYPCHTPGGVTLRGE